MLSDVMVAVGFLLFLGGLVILAGARRVEPVIDLRELPLELEQPIELEPATRYVPLAIEAKASSSSSRDE